MLAKMTHELKEVGLVTIYFLFGFGIILTLKKLFLAEYQIEVYAISVVVISALVAAKVVLILDHTRLGTRFAAAQPPGLAAIYKTLIYGIAAFFVIGGERIFPCLPGERRVRAAQSLKSGRIETATSFSPR
jgi:hypothetical protein